MIPELRDLSYEERLNECGLTTIETTQLRGYLIEVFKILNGYENIDRNICSHSRKIVVLQGSPRDSPCLHGRVITI